MSGGNIFRPGAFAYAAVILAFKSPALILSLVLNVIRYIIYQ